MSLGYDPEVPAGYQDADIEMAELTERANLIADLRDQGICSHNGWVGKPANGQIYYPTQEQLKPGQVACTDGCGRIFDSEQAILDDRERVLS